MEEVITKSPNETQQEGSNFAQKVKAGDVIVLYGDLGAGKTTFMQGLAKSLGITHRIISPTFIIVRKYGIPSSVILGRSETTTPESNRATDSGQARMTKYLYHIDLYRTETEEDLKGLGIPEILEEKNALIAIEWPEKLGAFLPKERWDVHLEWLNEQERRILLKKLK